MFFKAPKFWQKKSSLLSTLLTPFSKVYEGYAAYQSTRTPKEKVDVPIICVGNLVLGGAGKTPTVMALVKMLQKAGETPHIVSRGYGAFIKRTQRVNPKEHSYIRVGDEPLLLANVAPTWVGANRLQTLKTAAENGASVIVMDDGLQNPSFFKDFRLMVVDAFQGFGNEKVFPAGPLRESPEKGLKNTEAVLVIGDKSRLSYPIGEALTGQLKSATTFNPRPVVAFAGLGYPEKFRMTLKQYGYEVRELMSFPDHHPYTIPDVKKIKRQAALHNADIITTAKDYVRLPDSFKEHVSVFHVELEINEKEQLKQLLTQHLGISFDPVPENTSKATKQ